MIISYVLCFSTCISGCLSVTVVCLKSKGWCETISWLYPPCLAVYMNKSPVLRVMASLGPSLVLWWLFILLYKYVCLSVLTLLCFYLLLNASLCTYLLASIGFVSPSYSPSLFFLQFGSICFFLSFCLLSVCLYVFLSVCLSLSLSLPPTLPPLPFLFLAYFSHCVCNSPGTYLITRPLSWASASFVFHFLTPRSLLNQIRALSYRAPSF